MSALLGGHADQVSLFEEDDRGLAVAQFRGVEIVGLDDLGENEYARFRVQLFLFAKPSPMALLYAQFG